MHKFYFEDNTTVIITTQIYKEDSQQYSTTEPVSISKVLKKPGDLPTHVYTIFFLFQPKTEARLTRRNERPNSNSSLCDLPNCMGCSLYLSSSPATDFLDQSSPFWLFFISGKVRHGGLRRPCDLPSMKIIRTFGASDVERV